MDSILLIRFSIDKLNELPGPYEYQEGLLIGRAVPPELLNGMAVFCGDTLKTLQYLEYISLVAIKGDSELLKREIEPRIVKDEAIALRKAEPLTSLVRKITDPLKFYGIIQGDAPKEGGWCAKGLSHAWYGKSRIAPD